MDDDENAAWVNFYQLGTICPQQDDSRMDKK